MAGSIAFTQMDQTGIGKKIQQTGPACDNGECHGKIWEISKANAGQKNICLTCHVTQGVMSVFGFKAFLGALDHFPLPDEYYTHPEACVVCHTGREVHGGFAEEFGPLLVTMDSHGNSMHDDMDAKVKARKAEVYSKIGVKE